MRWYLLLLCAVSSAQTAADAALHAKRAAALAAQSRHQDAAAEYQKALDIHRSLGDRFNQGVVLNNLATSWISNGDPDTALPLIHQALAIREALNDQLGVAYSLLTLANAHWFSGEPQLALDAYRRLIAQASVVKNDTLLAHALNNGGLVLQSLGEDAAALAQHTRALALFQSTSQKLYEGYALNNAGLAQLNLARPASATTNFQQALAIFRELQDPRAQAYALHNLGDVELKANKPDSAIPFFRQSLELKRSARDRYGEAWSIARLAEANAAKGDTAGAVLLLQQALHLHRSVADRAGEASTLALLARLEHRAGQIPRAIQHLEDALSLIELTRNSVATPELRGSYFASRQSIYDFLIHLLVEQNDPRALEISERSRARLLLDNLAGDPKLESIRRSIHALGQRLQRASSLADAEAGRSRLRQLEAAAANFPPPDRGRPRSLKELQQLTSPDSAILEYWLGDQRSALFLIRPDSVKLIPLPPRKVIESQLAALLDSLTARGAAIPSETPAQRASRLSAADAAWPKIASSLAKLLWPAAQLASIPKVLIVPHHGLARLPFSLLPGAENTTITVSPSASLLPFLGLRSAAPSPLAVFAAPVFPPSLPPLPFARSEGESIARLVPGSTLRLGAAAANSPSLPADLARHRILHFATHVELAPSNPRIELSASALTLDNIYTLALDADLVTLSACRTALGRDLNGEGFLSFTRAFLYAGANRVLATLWSVDDQATALFMQNFYTSLLTRQRSPAESLSDARAALRKLPRYQHPWYWAAFALHGQWR
jgi:CHAT domain-containing protein